MRLFDSTPSGAFCDGIDLVLVMDFILGCNQAEKKADRQNIYAIGICDRFKYI